MTTIDQLRELEAAATPGPWVRGWWTGQLPTADAALIAEARNHLSALLDVAEAARAVIHRLHGTMLMHSTQEDHEAFGASLAVMERALARLEPAEEG